MLIRVGTSGWSYAEWKGVFYPEDAANADFLQHYGSRLPTVEVNNTFYRMPKPDVVDGWCAKVPDTFRFVIKASRRITHLQKLVDSDDSVGYLHKVSGGFKERLGAVLFQLPPTFRKDVEVLKKFLEGLPESWQAAFEFRHPSWFEDDVYAALRDANAACCGGEPEGKLVAPPVMPTGDWGYLRLRGEEYSDSDIDRWAARIREQAWKEAYVFFKHEELGPMLAGQLLERFGAAGTGGGPGDDTP